MSLTESTTLTLTPPSYDNRVPDDLLDYIEPYGLFIQRIYWSIEDRNPTVNYHHLRRDIKRLIKPVAKKTGNIELLKTAESRLDSLEGGNLSKPIYIESTVEQEGKYGWFTKKDAQVHTTVSLESIDQEVVEQSEPFPPNDWVETEFQAEEWYEKSGRLFKSGPPVDTIQLYLGPSEKTEFAFFLVVN